MEEEKKEEEEEEDEDEEDCVHLGVKSGLGLWVGNQGLRRVAPSDGCAQLSVMCEISEKDVGEKQKQILSRPKMGSFGMAVTW
jgi:hypothetical protein